MKFKFFLALLFSASTTIGVLGTTNFVAKADLICFPWDPPRCRENGRIGDSSPGVFEKIYVENAYSTPIWVSLEWYGTRKYCTYKRTGSTAGWCSYRPDDWYSSGYFKLQPGERSYVIGFTPGSNGYSELILGRNIYFHAHNQNGASWGRDITLKGPDGKPRVYSKADMGGNYLNEFTYKFR